MAAKESGNQNSSHQPPLKRLRDSVKKYDRPTDPVWDEYFESEGVSEDFMVDRGQSLKQRK